MAQSILSALSPSLAVSVAGLFKPGQRLGFLGIDFVTRRRNRLNVVVRSLAGSRLDVDVLQSYGNCPKYIQARQYDWLL